MNRHDVIVLGASAGGVEVLRTIVANFSPELAASVFVVLHVPPHGRSMLPAILSRAGALPATHPANEQPIEPGYIYVAPPDFHLMIERGRITLSRGPHENGHRPAVDVLFRSAARAYGPRVIGAVLSGTLDDGTAGLLAIKNAGGLAVVQDPAEAWYPGMPESALRYVAVDHIAPSRDLGALLERLSQEPAPAPSALPGNTEQEAEMAQLDSDLMAHPEEMGKPSGFACPQCGGALFELRNDTLVHYRCRVGHAFSGETLLAEQGQQLEDALWIALRALEENVALAERLAERALARGGVRSAEQFRERAQAARARAEIVRNALLSGTLTADENTETDEPAAFSDTG